MRTGYCEDWNEDSIAKAKSSGKGFGWEKSQYAPKPEVTMVDKLVKDFYFWKGYRDGVSPSDFSEEQKEMLFFNLQSKIDKEDGSNFSSQNTIACLEDAKQIAVEFFNK